MCVRACVCARVGEKYVHPNWKEYIIFFILFCNVRKFYTIWYKFFSWSYLPSNINSWLMRNQFFLSYLSNQFKILYIDIYRTPYALCRRWFNQPALVVNFFVHIDFWVSPQFQINFAGFTTNFYLFV